jgi:hypothetical protein
METVWIENFTSTSKEPPAPYAYCNLFLLPYIHIDSHYYNLSNIYAKKSSLGKSIILYVSLVF